MMVRATYIPHHLRVPTRNEVPKSPNHSPISPSERNDAAEFGEWVNSEGSSPKTQESTVELLRRHQGVLTQDQDEKEDKRILEEAILKPTASTVARSKFSYWKQISILVLTLAVTVAKILEPIIRSKFEPTKGT